MVDERLVRAGHAVGVLLLLCAVALAVVLALPSAIGAEASYVVLSDSMEPSISAGDVVVVRSVDTATLSTGDIVAFRTGASEGPSRITHRIVGVEQTDDGRMFRTKGDANEAPDSQLVAPENVIGSVWFHIPLVGRLVAFAGTSVGTFLLVVLPATLLVAQEIYSLYDEAVGDDGGEELP